MKKQYYVSLSKKFTIINISILIISVLAIYIFNLDVYVYFFSPIAVSIIFDIIRSFYSKKFPYLEINMNNIKIKKDFLSNADFSIEDISKIEINFIRRMFITINDNSVIEIPMKIFKKNEQDEILSYFRTYFENFSY